MKTTKRLLAVLLALVILCVGVPFAVQAEEGSALTGSCGENVTWSFDSSTGALTISGDGSITDYSWGGESPFHKYKANIRTVTINRGVTSIGSYVFYSCTALERVTISDSVTSIGNSTFRECTSLKSVTIPNSVMSIGMDAFFGCTSLINVTIGGSVTSIGESAFQDCEHLESIVLPNSLENIDDSMFRYCSSLSSITIPESIKSIGYAAFRGCCSLTSVRIPKNVLSIDDEAFFDCRKLESMEVDEASAFFMSDENGCLYNKEKTALIQYPIGKKETFFAVPNGVTYIGSWSFSLCETLTRIVIPDSVMNMGETPFAGCSNLIGVSVDEKNTAFCSDENGCLYNKEKSMLYYYPAGNPEKRFIIPSGVASIELGAFYNCNNLLHVTLPEGVTNISGAVFQDCFNLTSVAFPNSISFIGFSSFLGCSSLKDVYYCGSETEWTAITIEEANEPLQNAALHFHNPQIGQYVPATCTEEGYAPFYCAYCGKLTSVSDPEPPLGHNPKPVYTWADDDSTVTATMVCTRCDKTGMTETAEVKPEVTVKPTCSTEGELTLTAAFNNKSFYGQTKTKTLPRDPNAHVFKVTVTPPSCVDEGYTTHACTLCRYGYSDEIVPALGHDYQHHDAKAPTCEAPGWDAYDTCSRCDYTTYSELATVDHDDADNDGKCDMCGDQMRGGSHCKYCGKIHGGAFGWLTKLIHSILAVFKR